MVATWRMNKYERIVTEGAGELNTQRRGDSCEGHPAGRESRGPGSNLITRRMRPIRDIGVTAPIAGENMR